jgi:signal transduction histidine kinase
VRKRWPLALIGAAALVAAWSAWRQGGPPIVKWIASGGSYIAVGLYAWYRRPESRTGRLLVLTGWLFWSSIAEANRVPLFWTVGSALEAAWLPGLAYLLLSFPSGRLTATAQRLLFRLCVAFVAVVGVAGSLVYDPRDFGCTNCQPRLNLILVHSYPGYVRNWGGLVMDGVCLAMLAAFAVWQARHGSRAARRVVRYGALPLAALVAAGVAWPHGAIVTARLLPSGMLLLLALTAYVVARWWRASPPAQRVLGPMLLPAVALLLSVAAQQLIGGVLDIWTVFRPSPYLFRLLTDIAAFSSLALPVTFLVALARARRRHAVVSDLVVELGDLPAAGELERLLSRALRDPSLTVGRWDAARGEYLRADGTTLALPDEASGRTATLIDRAGTPLAAIVHDAALREEESLLTSVAAAARLVVENDGLQAEVRAQLAEVRASRARIVAAADAERRRLERDLHDGAQQRLVSTCLDLKLAASSTADPAARRTLAAAAESLQEALAELRELARGIHPAVLTDEGLGPALRSLAERSRLPTDLDYRVPDRLAATVEATAYFVASEALANVAKHANATRASVAVTRPDGHLVVRVADDGVGGADPARGSGLRGLMDRVGAVDGRLLVTTPDTGGTTVVAEIPCG